MSELLNHPLNEAFWRHDPPKPYACWVCGEKTAWIYLDLAYQHPDCDRYPTDGDDYVLIGGIL